MCFRVFSEFASFAMRKRCTAVMLTAESKRLYTSVMDSDSLNHSGIVDEVRCGIAV